MAGEGWERHRSVWIRWKSFTVNASSFWHIYEYIYEEHKESVLNNLERKRFVAWQYILRRRWHFHGSRIPLWFVDRNFYRKESAKFPVEMKKSSSNLSASTPSEIRSETKARLIYNKSSYVININNLHQLVKTFIHMWYKLSSRRRWSNSAATPAIFVDADGKCFHCWVTNYEII